jgi:hypothetical protein
VDVWADADVSISPNATIIAAFATALAIIAAYFQVLPSETTGLTRPLFNYLPLGNDRGRRFALAYKTTSET